MRSHGISKKERQKNNSVENVDEEREEKKLVEFLACCLAGKSAMHESAQSPCIFSIFFCSFHLR